MRGSRLPARSLIARSRTSRLSSSSADITADSDGVTSCRSSVSRAEIRTAASASRSARSTACRAPSVSVGASRRTSRPNCLSTSGTFGVAIQPVAASRRRGPPRAPAGGRRTAGCPDRDRSAAGRARAAPARPRGRSAARARAAAARRATRRRRARPTLIEPGQPKFASGPASTTASQTARQMAWNTAIVAIDGSISIVYASSHRHDTRDHHQHPGRGGRRR